MKYCIALVGFILFGLTTKAQTLQDYIQEAEANNPGIQAFEKRFLIAQEKINEANWLPNTEIGLGYFISEPETRTGAQVARFSTRQMVPWFGTISARQNLADAMAQTDYQDYVIQKRKIALKVARSYYRLYDNRAKQKVLEENIALLQIYEELALTAIEVDKATAVDVLRLQIRQNEIEQKNKMLQESFLAEQAAFNGLLNREKNAEVNFPQLLSLPDRESIELDSLQLNPEILKYDKMYESVAQEERLNQKERNPVFGIGLDYVPVEERPDLVFEDNGKDIVMPMVSMSIPIFNNRFDSKSKQNAMRQQELVFRKQERLIELETALARAISERNEARIIYDMQETNLKRAKDAEEILIKNYETGTIDFNDILDIQELQLKFQMAQISATQAFFRELMLINYLTN
ncbi:MAG: TolC family protein [Flavobacteriaceae bacterium]|nr:TolC family protein [Flavobacteriaceae bacterium]MDH3795739.1 TolC family protein [Flavobacteriaceae bacterium]